MIKEVTKSHIKSLYTSQQDIEFFKRLTYNITKKSKELIKMEHGIVFRGNGIFNYCGWPTVAKDKNGVLYAVCSGNRIGHVCPFGKNLMFKSIDDGKTWSEPVIINDTFLDDRDAGIIFDNEGRMVLSYFCHPASFYSDYYSEIIRTVKEEKRPLADGMIKTWQTVDQTHLKGGSYIRIQNGEHLAPAVKAPVSAPHGPTVLKDGRLLYVGKEFHSEMPLTKGGIYACAYDGKWEVLGEIPVTVPLNLVHEPHVIELDDGTLLAGLRVHNETSFTVYTTFSYDGGKSWTTPAPTGLNGSPPHFFKHSSGAIILSFARRELPYSERAVISRDNGRTWSKEIILDTDVHSNDIGYPSTTELSDGSLLTVYYQHFNDDEFTSVLYTKWSLSDVIL